MACWNECHSRAPPPRARTIDEQTATSEGLGLRWNPSSVVRLLWLRPCVRRVHSHYSVAGLVRPFSTLHSSQFIFQWNHGIGRRKQQIAAAAAFDRAENPFGVAGVSRLHGWAR